MNGQLNNDWLQGYLSALANVETAAKQFIKDSNDYERDAISGYTDIISYIKKVRSNYKTLVEELNAKSKD